MRLPAIRSLARRLHDGVLDERGRPYLDFVERVADRVAGLGGGRSEVATALLLGVIRHSYATVTGLLQLGVPVRVVRRLEAVDRRPYEPIDQQLKHLRQRRGAILVKRAEILEWLDDPPTDRWWRGERIRLLAALDAETLDPTRDPRSLIAAVADDGSDNQRYAAELLGLLRTAEAVEPLTAAVRRLGVDHGNADTRSHFLRAIARIMTGHPRGRWWSSPGPPPDPRWRPTLTSWLSDPHPGLRELAVVLVGRQMKALEVDRFIDLLQDQDDGVAAAAAGALGQVTLPHVSHPLRALLTAIDARHHRRAAAAARSLGQLRDRTASTDLARCLAHRYGPIREAAAWALTRIGEPSVIPMLRRAARGSAAGASAAWVLGEMRATEAVDDLIAGLVSGELSDYLLWDRCAEALGKLASERAADALVTAYHTGRAPARALWALGRIGADHALDVVLDATADPRPDVRAAAVRALTTATDPRAIPRLLDLCEGPHAGLAVRGLARAGDPRAIPALLRLIQSPPDRATQLQAGRGLAGMHPAWGLVSHLSWSYQPPTVRRIGAWVLSHAEDDAGYLARRLTELLRDPDPHVRAHAAIGVGRHKVPAASGAVEDLLTDPSPRVRATAATALGMLGRGKSRAALLSATSDPHKDVRAAAAAALRRLPAA
jgi:HEAT repeat protein